MSRIRWSLATLLVVFTVAQAAEGTHPGPLPPPHDAAAGTPTSPDYPYPGATAEGFGGDRPYGLAPGYGTAAGYPQDWTGGQAPGNYGYPTAPGYGQRGGYGYEGSPGPGGPTAGRDQPRGYWIWVPAEAVESTLGGYGAPQPSYGGYDRGYRGYPSYPGEATTDAYSTLPPGPAERGADAYPAYGSDAVPPGEGWWGTGGGGAPGEAFGDSGTPAGSRSFGMAPPGPASAPAPAPRPAASEAGQSAATKDSSPGFRPLPGTEPAPGTN